MTTPVVASPRLRSVLLVILLCLGAAAPLSAQLKTKQNVTGVGRRAVVQGKGPKVPAGRSFDIINLEGLQTGQVVSTAYSRNGLGPILIHGTNPAFGSGTNAAVIFDSSSPTGDDADLGSPNETFGGPGVGAAGEMGSPTVNNRPLKKVLIVAEDLVDTNGNLLVDDPDDCDLKGSTLSFDFSAVAPVTLTRINYIDIEADVEDGAYVELFGDVGQSLAVFPMPPTGDNGRISLALGPTRDVYSVNVVLNGSGAVDTLAFTKDCGGAIGDFLWHDLDCDGLQDIGEPGLQGVTVNLLDEQGGTLDTRITGPDGAFNFRGLCAGTYTVEVDESTLPPGFTPAPCRVGGNNALDNDCSPVTVVLAGDSVREPTIDFGYCAPCDGSLGDFIWHDLDCDGVQDDGEPGIEGILVRLFDGGGQQVAMQSTGPNGAYTFTGLCGGNYTVEVDESTLPPGYFAAPCDVGNDDSADSDCSPASVTLTGTGDTDGDTDFGYCVPCTGSIGDLVWKDLDCDGVQDPDEAGLQGVTVILEDAQGDRIASKTTAADGSYRFTGLCAGTYSVLVDPDTLPPGFTPAPCDIGVAPGIDSDCGTVVVVLNSDSSSETTIDFGFCSPCTGRIGDFVWRDLNADNLQDPGEPGIAGVRLILRDAQQVVLAQTTTDSDGFYEFTGLCPGTYEVSYDPETAPTDLSPVLCDFGIDDDVDSDCSPTTVTLTDTDISVDFGFQGCAPCAGGLISMTLRYQGAERAFIEVRTEANCAPDEVFFSGNVDSLEAFSFFGTASDGKFPKDIKVFVDGVEFASIHTSCSQSVGPGTVFGIFEVVTASSLYGGTICSCGPCEGGLTSLTLLSVLPDVSYIVVRGATDGGGGGKGSGGKGSGGKGSDGKGSDGKGSGGKGSDGKGSDGKGSGGKGSDGKGSGGKGSGGKGSGGKGSGGGSGDSSCDGSCEGEILFEGIVGPLSEFSFTGTGSGGKLPKDICIVVDDVLNTTIHTSCSKPVGPGTQHGDFLVLAGASKGNGPICDSDETQNGECDEGTGYKVQSITCIYTGESDAVAVTQQSGGSHNVDDFNGGPALAPTVYIVVRNPNRSKTWFAGTVNLGGTFPIDASALDLAKLDNQTFIEIYDASGTVKLQQSDFHTSCSEPLTVNDRYGAVDIVELGLVEK